MDAGDDIQARHGALMDERVSTGPDALAVTCTRPGVLDEIEDTRAIDLRQGVYGLQVCEVSIHIPQNCLNNCFSI
jgi:hypothetical protein